LVRTIDVAAILECGAIPPLWFWIIAEKVKKQSGGITPHFKKKQTRVFSTSTTSGEIPGHFPPRNNRTLSMNDVTQILSAIEQGDARRRPALPSFPNRSLGTRVRT
jgi:hypothetical protein